MINYRHYQLNLLLDPTQSEIRIPPIARDQLKELLGSMMVVVLEGEKRKKSEEKKKAEKISLKETDHE